MRTWRNVLVVLALGGLAAGGAVVGAGTSQDVSGTVAAARPVVERVPEAEGTPLWFGEASPEAPTLEELLPARNVPLTAKAKARMQRTIGKLYTTFPDGTEWWGTATVVTSRSRDLLITAAHLLVDRRGQRPTLVRFVPGDFHGQGQYGSWYAREWAVPPSYRPDGPLWAQDDVAVVLLNTRLDKHIEDVVDGQGICFDCSRRGLVHVYGYPDNFDDGTALDLHCQVYADFNDLTKPFGLCVEGEPYLTQGSSGAPVFANFFDPNTGQGWIIAVNTWGPEGLDSTLPGNNGGVYLSGTARALYEEYQGR